MTFANIQLPPNIILDPMLKELVHKLALDMPAFTFGTKGIEPNDMNYHTSKTAYGDRTVSPPEGFDYLTKVRAYKGPEHLGDIFLDRRYSRRGGTKNVYAIRSWRIDNQRGNANTSTTDKLVGAVRIVKKNFVPQNMTEVVEKGASALSSGFYTACRDLSRPILNNQMGPHNTVMQKFLYQVMNGVVDPAGADVVRKHFTSDKYHKAMSECLLAEKMEKLKYVSVVVYNNAFLIRSSTGDTAYKSFDELPESMQNAISVLQLMEDGEVVDDVGYRHDDTHFLIVETV